MKVVDRYRGVVHVRVVRTDELLEGEIRELRRLFEVAWPDPADAFTDDDWAHAIGGIHLLVHEPNGIVAHASIVERELHAGGRPLRTGYVEAVATRPDRQRRGYGTAVMREVGRHIDRTYEVGALGTGEFAFYERLGWVRWRGPTAVRTPAGLVRTPDDDGYVMIHRTPTTPGLDLEGPLSCDWRSGDVW